jgi:hypothetical protein
MARLAAESASKPDSQILEAVYFSLTVAKKVAITW